VLAGVWGRDFERRVDNGCVVVAVCRFFWVVFFPPISCPIQGFCRYRIHQSFQSIQKVQIKEISRGGDIPTLCADERKTKNRQAKRVASGSSEFPDDQNRVVINKQVVSTREMLLSCVEQ
jgi:hypothetical protein